MGSVRFSACLLLTSIFLVLGVYGEALATATEYLASLERVPGTAEFWAGQTTWVTIKVTNRGSRVLPAQTSDPARPVRIAYHWIDAQEKIAIYEGLRTDLPEDLGPGESLVIRAAVVSPMEAGTYTLVLDLVREHVTWFADQGSPPLKISAIPVRKATGITWQRGRILLITGGAIFLLFVMGFGAARCFVGDLWPVLILPMGTAIVIACGYYTSLLGIPMRTAKWGILTLGIGSALVAAVARRPAAQPGWRGTLFCGIPTAVLLVLTLAPLWRFGRPSTVQTTYAAYSVVISEYWRHHTLTEIPALDPSQPLDFLVRERLLHRYVTDAPFLNAFIASMFDLDSYETYSILTALLLALLPATLYWVARIAFRAGRGASGLVCLLALCNTTYQLWVPGGQLTFVAGLLFVPMAVGAGRLFIDGRGNLVMAAISLATLLAAYSPLAPYGLVPLLCYGGLQVWKRALPLRVLGVRLFTLLLLMALINPVALYYLAASGLTMASQISENWHNIPAYPSMAELLGLLPHFASDRAGPLLRLLAFGLVPAVLGCAGYGLYRSWQEGRWLLLATGAPYALAGYTISGFMNYPYGYYKHAVVTLFVLLVAFADGVESLWRSRRPYRMALAIGSGGGFLVACALAFMVTLGMGRSHFVSPELASLTDVKHVLQKGERVFLDVTDVALQLWISYFLWGVRLSVPPAFEPWGWWGFSSVSGRGDPLQFFDPHTAYTLRRWGEITRPGSEPVWGNGWYLLQAGAPVLFLDQGWYALEEGPSPFRWMTREGTLRIRSDSLNGKPGRLKMTFVPLRAPLTLEVLLEGEKLGTFTAQDPSYPVRVVTQPFTVAGEAIITIRAVEGCFEPARLFGSDDRRCLSARFHEVGLMDKDR